MANKHLDTLYPAIETSTDNTSRTMEVDYGKTRDGQFQLTHWPHLLHRKISPALLDQLERNHPQFNFEILTIFENRSTPCGKSDPGRVRILIDPDGVIVRVPVNG